MLFRMCITWNAPDQPTKPATPKRITNDIKTPRRTSRSEFSNQKSENYTLHNENHLGSLCISPIQHIKQRLDAHENVQKLMCVIRSFFNIVWESFFKKENESLAVSGWL